MNIKQTFSESTESIVKLCEHWTENAKQKQLLVMNEKSTLGSTFLWMHNECQTVIIPCKYKLPDENSFNIKYFRMDWSRSSVENKSFVHSRRHHDVFWIESWDYLMTFRKLLKWKQRSAYEMTSKYLAKKNCLTQQKNDNHVLSRRRLLENSLTIIWISLHGKKNS